MYMPVTVVNENTPSFVHSLIFSQKFYKFLDKSSCDLGVRIVNLVPNYPHNDPKYKKNRSLSSGIACEK